MLLAIDVGNTNLAMGLFNGEKLEQTWRMETNSTRTADEYGALFSGFKGMTKEVDDIIITSVVPRVTRSLTEMASKYYQIKPHRVVDFKDKIMPIEMDYPEQVGTDRIVNGYIASTLYGNPAIVVDMGTADTYDVISKNGAYIGGAILPGLQISMEGLFKKTALLPEISFKRPPSVIGKRTTTAIQSGLYYGQISKILGLVARIEKELGEPAKKVLTGGWANCFNQEDLPDFVIDPDLTLKGLQLIHAKFCKK